MHPTRTSLGPAIENPSHARTLVIFGFWAEGLGYQGIECDTNVLTQGRMLGSQVSLQEGIGFDKVGPVGFGEWGSG